LALNCFGELRKPPLYLKIDIVEIPEPEIPHVLNFTKVEIMTTTQAESKEPPRPLHDTHAIPPQGVQEVYWKYNQMKASAFAEDAEIVDFSRGLSPEQSKFLKPVATIPSAIIEKACFSFRNYGTAPQNNDNEPGHSDIGAQPALLYEHLDFPGK